jgi:hypothetical protein
MVLFSLPWIALAIVAGLGRVGFLWWRSSRQPNSTLTPNWTAPPVVPKKQRSIRRTILLTVLLDPFVLFFLVLILTQIFGPLRPVHEWIR